jgi:hypothetical protein
LQPLVKLGKTMQQPLHASKMKKIEKLQPLHKLKETLSKCSLCLPKCKLKNYVVTFAHLLNCTCYVHTPIYLKTKLVWAWFVANKNYGLTHN